MEKSQLTIFCTKCQILMNNPRVHSQTAQNLDVKRAWSVIIRGWKLQCRRKHFITRIWQFSNCVIFLPLSTYLHSWSPIYWFKMCNLAFGWLTKVHRSHLIPVAGGVGERDWGLILLWFLFSSFLIYFLYFFLAHHRWRSKFLSDPVSWFAEEIIKLNMI